MHARPGKSVTVRFALPAPALRPYVTTYYRTEFVCGPGEWLEDYLHPEWANLRFLGAVKATAAIGGDPVTACPAFAVTGPTSRAMRFRISGGYSWGIGLLPLGWASLCRVDADNYADRFVDGRSDPAFAPLVPLGDALAASSGDYAEDLALIEAHMARLFGHHEQHDAAILALNDALLDPEMVSVADLTARLGMNVRSLERLSRRAFGFPPKLLLRRQRFLRSLARFMLDPSLKWLGALDCHYHDQSHFVRDFKRFMGMSPSAYAKLEKPLLAAAMRARMEIAGAAVQALHQPHPAAAN
ncbi:MAG: helix-turn-helix domain-containing protein [Erythrobacter sp.]